MSVNHEEHALYSEIHATAQRCLPEYSFEDVIEVWSFGSVEVKRSMLDQLTYYSIPLYVDGEYVCSIVAASP